MLPFPDDVQQHFQKKGIFVKVSQGLIGIKEQILKNICQQTNTVVHYFAEILVLLTWIRKVVVQKEQVFEKRLHDLDSIDLGEKTLDQLQQFLDAQEMVEAGVIFPQKDAYLGKNHEEEVGGGLLQVLGQVNFAKQRGQDGGAQ